MDASCAGTVSGTAGSIAASALGCFLSFLGSMARVDPGVWRVALGEVPVWEDITQRRRPCA